MATAESILSAPFSVPENPQGKLRAPGLRASDLVCAALRSLTVAGLLELKRSSVWCITAEGKALSEAKPGRLTFDMLKQYPSYNAYWAEIARDNHRQDFLNLRFEHYSSGRLLFLQGSHTAAGVLLAYAIEYHLKAALIERESHWKEKEHEAVKKKHNLAELYELCLKHELLVDSYVSPDFMNYAHHQFERRYPSGAQSIMAERGYWSFGGTLLHTYDDCIIQLDHALASMYGSQEYEMTCHALTDTTLSPHLTDAFFHANVFAVEHVSVCGNGVSSERQLNVERTHLQRPDKLFFRDGLPPPALTFESGREFLDWHLAAYFRYPGRDEPDPDPVRVSASWERDRSASLGVSSSRWVIDRVTKVFGRSAVELTEDRTTGEVFLTVFDRRAKKWHHALTLRDGVMQRFFRNKANEALVEQWIKRLQSRFSGSRRKLRIPNAKTETSDSSP